jgi:hypothetical protein
MDWMHQDKKTGTTISAKIEVLKNPDANGNQAVITVVEKPVSGFGTGKWKYGGSDATRQIAAKEVEKTMTWQWRVPLTPPNFDGGTDTHQGDLIIRIDDGNVERPQQLHINWKVAVTDRGYNITTRQFTTEIERSAQDITIKQEDNSLKR